MTAMPFETLKNFVHKTPGKLIVAVSGGADSVCLFHAMKATGREFTVLHCNHRLRGRESDLDEKFVRGLWKSVKVFRKKIKAGPGMEERARDWRRECYAKAGAKYVYLAHHAGDQTETLLLNLMRGAGLAGAAGMREMVPLGKVRLVRPWLEMDPKHIRKELKSRKLSWREDASNQDTDLKRNALRKKILPVLEKVLPGASLRMAAFCRRASEAADVLDAVVDKELRKIGASRTWDREALLKMEPGLRRLVLKRLGGRIMDEAAILRAELLLLKGSGKADLRLGYFLETNRKTLRLRK
ncbi:MAG: tRNA lysidine(34) synthetase TilS [candidate division FCPU426 bacterium]